MSAVAGAAYLVLSKMVPESIDPLITSLSSPDVQVRMLAAGALAEIGPDAKAAIPILEKDLADTDPNTRANTALFIGKLGGNLDSFLPVVIEALPQMDPSDLDNFLGRLSDYRERNFAIPILAAILDKTEHSTNCYTPALREKLVNALQQANPTATNNLMQ
jgi:hypothetical protein